MTGSACRPLRSPQESWSATNLRGKSFSDSSAYLTVYIPASLFIFALWLSLAFFSSSQHPSIIGILCMSLFFSDLTLSLLTFPHCLALNSSISFSKKAFFIPLPLVTPSPRQFPMSQIFLALCFLSLDGISFCNCTVGSVSVWLLSLSITPTH